MGGQLRLREGPLHRPGPLRQARPRPLHPRRVRGEEAGPVAVRPQRRRRDRGRGQARFDRRLDRAIDLHLQVGHVPFRKEARCPLGKEPDGHPRSRHRLHRPHADRQGLSRRVQRHPVADPRRPRIRAAVERVGRRSGRDRRRHHRRRAPAGRAGDDRPHRRLARRPAGHRPRHVDRPPVRLRPDGDRHRRQAGHRRPDGRLRRRRRRIDLDGADRRDAARRRPRARRDAQGRLHADDRHRRGGRQALRHQPRPPGRLCAPVAAAHRRRPGRRQVRRRDRPGHRDDDGQGQGDRRDLDEGGDDHQGRGQPRRDHARGPAEPAAGDGPGRR